MNPRRQIALAKVREALQAVPPSLARRYDEVRKSDMLRLQWWMERAPYNSLMDELGAMPGDPQWRDWMANPRHRGYIWVVYESLRLSETILEDGASGELESLIAASAGPLEVCLVSVADYWLAYKACHPPGP